MDKCPAPREDRGKLLRLAIEGAEANLSRLKSSRLRWKTCGDAVSGEVDIEDGDHGWLSHYSLVGGLEHEFSWLIYG